MYTFLIFFKQLIMHKMTFYLLTYDTFIRKNDRKMKQTQTANDYNNHSRSPYATVTGQGNI